MKFVGRGNTYVVRGSSVTAAALRDALHAVDPEVVVKTRRMEELIGESIAQPRFRTWLIVTFAVMALALASVGIYGVMAYSVAQRDKELGLRIALGAGRIEILRLVLGRAVAVTGGGILCGLAGAFLLARFIGNLLFGISVHDPATFIGVPVVLGTVALVASYLPAARATRVDPMKAVRDE